MIPVFWRVIMILDDKFQADYYRMTGRKFRIDQYFIINILARHNVRFAFWYRIHQAAKSGIVSRIALYRLSRKYGLEFSTSASIGKGLYLGHPYNITVGDGVRLGNNVNIHKGATIGVENRGSRIGAPTIGDRVFIGINSTVIGNIVIGDDVMICPGAFVNFDVPFHSVVIGNPGVIHTRMNATKDYVVNCV